MSKENLVDVMVDIETLGTTPGCVILSLAAVPFKTISPLEIFYRRISKVTCIQFGMHVDDDTVKWWSRQPMEAQLEAFNGTEDVLKTLEDFNGYLKILGNVRLWGNGASFDVPILEESMRMCGVKPAWRYYNSMCFRTLKALFPTMPYTPPTIAHNALEDAKAQAAHADKIFNFMKF